MEWPNKETSFSLCISKKCDTSAAMCSYVMGAMCGEEPWFLRSRAYTGRFRSDMNAFVNEFQLRFEPLMEIYLLQREGMKVGRVAYKSPCRITNGFSVLLPSDGTCRV